jgi:hypothetical protein
MVSASGPEDGGGMKNLMALFLELINSCHWLLTSYLQ